MREIQLNSASEKIIIRKCHACGKLNDSYREVQRCDKCRKSFLPLNYFGKIHAKNETEFKNLFASSNELTDDDLLKGLMALW